ncbi:MAG: magnesium transporter [Dehalococcoidia bacterium]|nr:magnesium transporter [Dehalococcoidia bacterium]
MTVEVQPKQPDVQTIKWGGLTWVNIEHPTRAEMSYLRQEFGFHPLALDDCLSRVQLPKIDEYDNYLFLVLHFPLFNKVARLTQPSQVTVFASASYIVTIHHGELRPLTKLFQDCSQNESVRKDLMSRSSGYLLYRILDVLIDYCFPILNKVIGNVERMESEFFASKAAKIVQEFSFIRRDIIAYRRIIRPQIAVMETLEAKEYAFLKLDPDVYFGDLADHTRRIWEGLEEQKEVADGLSDALLTMNLVVNNDAMRDLTVIFTIFLPMTIISSLYGMNVPLPGGADPGGHVLSFFGVIALSVAISGGMLYWFKRKGWV